MNKSNIFRAARPADGYSLQYCATTFEGLCQQVKEKQPQNYEDFKFLTPRHSAKASFELEGIALAKSRVLYHAEDYASTTLIPGYLHFDQGTISDYFRFGDTIHLSADRDAAIFAGLTAAIARKLRIASAVKDDSGYCIKYRSFDALKNISLDSFMSSVRIYLYSLINPKVEGPDLYSDMEYYRTDKDIAMSDLDECHVVNMRDWISKNNVRLELAGTDDQVKHLYFYDLKLRTSLETLAKSGKISKDHLEEERSKAKAAGRISSEFDRLTFFPSKIPVEHMDWIFRGEHSIWVEGRTVYEYRVSVDQLPPFTFEIVDTPEEQAYRTSPLLGGDRSPEAVVSDLKTMMKYRGWVGRSVHELKSALLPFVGLCYDQFAALMRRSDRDNILEDMAPSVTRVYIYPNHGTITDIRATKLSVGSKPIKAKKKYLFQNW